MILVAIAALFIGGGCLYKENHTGSFSDVSPMAKTEGHFPDTVPAPWQKFSSTIELYFHYDDFVIEVSGTATGAAAKYHTSRLNPGGCDDGYMLYHIIYGDNEPVAETVLDTAKWHNLLNSIFNSGIRELDKKWGSKYGFLLTECIDAWGLDIFTRAGDTLISFCGGSFYGRNTHPLSLSVVKGIADNLIRLISDKINIQLDLEYETMYGISMPDFMRSIMLVVYKETAVHRTMAGIIKATRPWADKITSPNAFELELGISDWLDILHSLDNNGSRGTYKKFNMIEHETKNENAYIEHSSREDIFAFERMYLPPSDKFKKVMEAINAKIKERMLNEAK